MEFLLSRAGRQKDAQMLERIRAIISRDPLASVLVLVPPQATYLTEKKLLDELALPGMMGLCVLGPEKLTQRILDHVYGRSLDALTGVGRCMAFSLLLKRCAPQLPALGSTRYPAHIAQGLADLAGEFATMDISAQKLRGLATDDVVFTKKLHDIAKLLEEYDRLLAEKNLSSVNRTETAIAHVRESRWIAQSDVFVTGFDMFSEQMLRYLQEIEKTAKSLHICLLDGEGEDTDREIFSLPQNCIRKLNDRFDGVTCRHEKTPRVQSAGIAHLEKNLYAYPYQTIQPHNDVLLVRADTREQEVLFAAEQIAKLHAGGIPMREIAVLSGHAPRYARLIKKHFTDAHIPFFMDEKRALNENPLSDFLLSAAEACIGRLKKDRVVAHMKTGFLGTEDEALLLQNEIREHVSNAYRLEKSFEDPALEEARQHCLVPFFTFFEEFKKQKTAGGQLACLEKYMEDCGAEQTLLLRAQELALHGKQDSAEYLAQVPEKIREVFAQIRMLAADLPADALGFCELLTCGLQSVRLSTIPLFEDAVFVGEVATACLPPLRALIMLGVNEGEIPNYEEKTDLLTPRQREYLLGALAGLSNAGALYKQKLAVYKAVSAPDEKLILCTTATDGEEECCPSALIYRVSELLHLPIESAAAHIGSLLQNALLLGKAQLCQNRENGLIAVLKQNYEARGELRLYERLSASAQMEPLTQKTAGALFEKSGAVTRIETFFACPYRHFLSYGIKPDLEKDERLASMETGSYVHAVLDKAVRRLREYKKPFSGISQEELSALIREISAAERQENVKYTLDGENENVLNMLDREIRLVLTALLREKSYSGSIVAGTEIHFDREIGGVQVRGLIDRLDIAERDGRLYCSVIDYKTGDQEFSFYDYVQGLSLQLGVYLIAAQALYAGVQPVAAGYCRIALPKWDGIPQSEHLADFDLNGIQLDDMRLLDMMYGRDGKQYIGIKLTCKQNKKAPQGLELDVRAQKRSCSPEQMQTLMRYAENRIAESARRLAQGEIAAEPTANAGGEYKCKNCDYQTVCGMPRENTEKNAYTREQAFEKMEMELLQCRTNIHKNS